MARSFEDIREINLALSWAALAGEDLGTLFTPLTLQAYAEYGSCSCIVVLAC